MEHIKLDPKVKQAMDLFDWNKIERKIQPNNTIESYNGMLHQIGCDFESLMMDMISIENAKEIEKCPNPQRPKDCRPQPRFSSLSQKQHIEYLNHREKIRNTAVLNATAWEQKISVIGIKTLHSKVLQEQQEYEDYALQVAIDRLASYNYISPAAEKVFKQIITHQMKRLQQYIYPYVFHQTFVISVFPYLKDPQPKYEDLCAKLGKPLYITVPVSGSDETFPVYNASEVKSISMKSIMEDENAYKLAKVLNADVVITISALRTLANNSKPFSNEWEMPMTIKEIEDDKGKMKNVVFIDKALPPKSVNQREKMYRYFKKVVKQFVLKDGSMTPTSTAETKNKDSTAKSIREDGIEVEGAKDCSSQEVGSDISSSDTSSDSDESIPQLDGTDDKVKEKKSNSSGRKTRVSSVPESSARSALWKDSFKKLPKQSLRSNSTSSTSTGFTKWTAEKNEKKEKSKPEASARISESENDLVIDTASEAEEKDEKLSSKPPTNLPAASDAPLMEEEQEEITFKATEIPSTILDSVLNDDDSSPEDVSSSAEEDIQSKPSPSEASPTPIRRSSRNRSKTQTEPEITSPPRRSLRQRIRSESDGLKQSSEEKASKNTTKAAKPSRKRSKKDQDSSASEKLSKVVKPVAPAQDTEDKSNKKRKTRSNPKTNTKESKSARSKKKLRIRYFSSSSDDTPLSEIKKVETNGKSSPNRTKSPIFLVGDAVSVKKPQIDPSQKKSGQPHGSGPTDIKTPDEAEKPKEEKSGDVLGQILNMQKSRNETLQENALPKKGPKTHFQPVIPSVPRETEDQDFDSMLKLHSIKLSDPGKNVFYSLWSFGSLRVLIRGGLHGRIMQEDNSNDVCEHATIRTKLEYLPDLGFERLTKSEACSEWLDLQFRPQPSTVLRCRVDPLKQTLLRCDRVKNESSTYLDFKAAGFNHLQANKLLLSVFQKLTTKRIYNKGAYLICHKHGANEFVIRKENLSPTSKMVIYDLLREYANPGRTVLSTPQTIPWVPLDPWKQTLWQQAYRRVPMTFDLKQLGAEVSKKKKGKKKNQIDES